VDLLDTDVMVDVARGYQPALEWLASLEQAPGLPSHVAMEMIQGCRDGFETAKMQRRLREFKRCHPTSDDLERAEITFARCNLSHKLGLLDAIIGELAVGLDATLYTFNCKHYRCVKDLNHRCPYDKPGKLAGSNCRENQKADPDSSDPSGSK